MRHRPEDVAFLEDRAARGIATPALDNRPELAPHLNFVWEAFSDLNAGRQYGMAANPLLLSEIVCWLDLHGFDEAFERRWYVRMFRVLDAEYLRLNAAMDKAAHGNHTSHH